MEAGVNMIKYLNDREVERLCILTTERVRLEEELRNLDVELAVRKVYVEDARMNYRLVGRRMSDREVRSYFEDLLKRMGEAQSRFGVVSGKISELELEALKRREKMLSIGKKLSDRELAELKRRFG